MEQKNESGDYEYHVLAIPYPSQGHINPMLHFCKRLASYGGGTIKTTLATTVFISNTFSPDPTSTAPVHFATFSDGFDKAGFTAADSISHYLDSLHSAGSRTLAELIKDRVDLVIYDAFLPWALEVSKRSGVRAAAFFTQACTVNYVYYLIHHRRLSLPMDAFPIPVRGLDTLSSPRDMPSFVGVPGSYPAYFEMVLSQFSNAERADFVLVNSVYELEREAADSMSEVCPLLTIGPTIPSMYLDKRILNDNHYGFNLFADNEPVREWLDAKPKRSVVYVSFGSMACLSPEQMTELAMGLQSAGFHFLWAIRSSEEWKLDRGIVSGFEKGKGLMVKWSPQLEVLAHEAVGCFFTHCGWNSTVEALSLGVPMVGMPQWTDQPTDAALVQELWKVGVRVAVDEATGIVNRHEVERCIRLVMGSDEMRANALKWSRVAVGAVSDGGSSDNNIHHFISQLKHKN